MYTKNRKLITDILKNYKAEKADIDESLQAIQNIIGEEMERKDKRSALYEVNEEEFKTNV